MPIQLLPARKVAWIMPVMLAMTITAFSLAACAPGTGIPQSDTPTVASSLPATPKPPVAMPTRWPATPMPSVTKTQVKTATPVPTLSPTATATERWVPTPFTNSLEAFGMVYDPDARLEIPPWGSISMLFWGQAVPVQPIQATPEFISYPDPQLEEDAEGLIEEAGCQRDEHGDVECPEESALSGFGCAWMEDPRGVGFGLEPKNPLVAVCQILTEEHEAAKAGGVHLIGCAFKRTIHYIFLEENDYVLVSSADELIEMFAPIDSPEEALSYAQMVTGLEARYGFEYDPTLMYFDESIEGTRVSETESGFEMNLFNLQGCGCEPWINSKIDIRVDRAGEITWMDAVPISMTTGWSCAD